MFQIREKIERTSSFLIRKLMYIFEDEFSQKTNNKKMAKRSNLFAVICYNILLKRTGCLWFFSDEKDVKWKNVRSVKFSRMYRS